VLVIGLGCTAGWAQAGNEPRSPLPTPGASAADDIGALDRQVQVILAEARRQQAQLAEQRQRLAAAEAANAWLPWMGLALVGLAVLSGVLGLRLQRMKSFGRAGAMSVDGDLPPAAPAAVDGSVSALAQPERPLLAGLADDGSMPAPLAAAPARVSTQALRLVGDRSLSGREQGFGTGVPPRPVSVEELLDLDQQVDFFLALGQAQSAVDLLLGHVRSTGGTSALPYFKLLEIYRGQNDQEAYERTRERFNQRFNAHAPDWDGDLQGGRLLEDYTEVLQRLQRAWPQPMRAVAELESMLLRRADLEPFDMPAYRDVLMLHALVRDLPASSLPPTPPPALPVTTPAVLSRDEPAAPARPAAAEPALAVALAVDAVDLLLPLGEPLDTTLPQPHLADHQGTQALLADWVFTRAAKARAAQLGGDAGAGGERASRPMKLDLDLSEYAPAPREFTRPAAFTDIDMRRDRRLSDLGGLDEHDSSDPLPSRR